MNPAPGSLQAESHRTAHTTLIWCCWTVAVLLGALQAWLHRYSINTDGISYADVGQAFVSGNWSLAINGYWSPLYPWLLGSVLAIVKPSLWQEFPVYHAVNFAVFLLALTAFHFFLAQVIRTRRTFQAAGGDGGRELLPEPYLIAFGFVLFLYATLDLISLEIVSPDLGVACVVFVAARQLLRIHDTPLQWKAYLLLGAALGIGYLVKAPVLPVGLVFLASCLLARAPWGALLPRTAAAFVVLLALAMPFVIALSMQKGRPTAGDSARLNYAWYINGISRYNWQGTGAALGTPRHTTRAIAQDPDVWEFATPVEATYPTWADPSYWNDGLTPRLSVRGQVRTILENAREYYYIGHQRQTSVVLAFALLLGGGGVLAWATGRFVPMLLLPSIAAACMFLLVHVEGRFLAGYVVISWVALFGGLRLPSSTPDRRWTRTILAGTTVLLTLEVLAAVLSAGSDQPVHERTAQAITTSGVGAGSRVAIFWPGGSRSYAWARLARHRIVAEAEIGGCQFFALPAGTQAAVLGGLSESSAAYAVATDIDCAVPAPWKMVPDTKFAILALRDAQTRGVGQ